MPTGQRTASSGPTQDREDAGGDTAVALRAAAAAVSVDDRHADALLSPALIAAGCTRAAAATHLVHVGAAPAVRSVPGVLLEPMAEATVL
jgi:hypothetical protein